MAAIIAQILTILSNYCSSWAIKKHNIILFRILSAFFSAISIVAVGNIVGAIPVFFTIIRCIVCYFKDKFKNNWPIYLICAGYIVIAACSIPFYTTILDIIPVLVSLPAAVILWFCNPIGIKAGVGIGDTLWLIYDLYNGLYLSALNIFIQIIISIISIIRIKIKL